MRDADGDVLADLVHAGDRWLAAAGGQGGRGNARFLSNRRRAPGLRRAGRGGRGALAAARAQAHGRRRARRLPQRRQEHADLARSRRPSRRSPTTRSPRSSRTSASCGSTTATSSWSPTSPASSRGPARARASATSSSATSSGPGCCVVLVDLAADGAGAARPSRSAVLLARARRLPARAARAAPPRASGRRADIGRRRRRRCDGPARLGGHRRGRRARWSGRMADAGRAGPGRPSPSPTAFVVHRPGARGRPDRARRRRRVPGRRPARPSGPSPCPTSPTPTRSTTPSDRLDKLGVDKALARAGARTGDIVRIGALRVRVSSPTSDLTVPTARRVADRRRQDRHVVDHRRRRRRSTRPRSPSSAPRSPSCGPTATRSWWSRRARSPPGCRRSASAATAGPRDAVTLQAVVGGRPEPADAGLRPACSADHGLVGRPGAARPARLRACASSTCTPGRPCSGCSSSASCPVVNENDAIADDEIRFGDNDRLAALVAHLVDADLLVLLTDTAGLLTADPRLDASASLIEEIVEVDHELEARGRRRRARCGGAAAWRRSSPRPRSPPGRACGR